MTSTNHLTSMGEDYFKQLKTFKRLIPFTSHVSLFRATSTHKNSYSSTSPIQLGNTPFGCFSQLHSFITSSCIPKTFHMYTFRQSTVSGETFISSLQKRFIYDLVSFLRPSNRSTGRPIRGFIGLIRFSNTPKIISNYSNHRGSVSIYTIAARTIIGDNPHLCQRHTLSAGYSNFKKKIRRAVLKFESFPK